MNHKAAALEVVKTINASGYLALYAGGCVRDMLLGTEPKDYDIATNAAPDIVSEMFPRTVEVGAQFGVIMVMVKSEQIEVATFRSESGYVDGRRPGKIEFTDAKEDALRRDFTINGMFYNPLNEEILDYVGGQIDLEKKCIRTIGEPKHRFSEDYLRMLRAVRFAAQLDFEIDSKTWQEVKLQSHKISQISGERIASELKRAFESCSRARGISLFVESGLAQTVFPEISEESLACGAGVVSRLTGDVNLALGLAALLSNCSKADAIGHISSLKLSRKNCADIKWLLYNKDALVEDEISLGELKVLLANENFWKLFHLQLALCDENVANSKKLAEIKQRANSLEGCDLTPTPFLDGHEIMALGIEKGPQLGKIFQELHMKQLNEEISSKSQAIEWVENRGKR